MTERYQADPATGCGLMILIGAPLVLVVWFLAALGFGRLTGWF